MSPSVSSARSSSLRPSIPQVILLQVIYPSGHLATRSFIPQVIYPLGHLAPGHLSPGHLSPGHLSPRSSGPQVIRPSGHLHPGPRTYFISICTITDIIPHHVSCHHRHQMYHRQQMHH